MKRILNLIFTNWSISTELKKDSIGRCLFFLRIVFFIICNKFLKINFTENLSYRSRDFIFKIDDRMDIAVLWEIFVKKEYEFPYVEMSEGNEAGSGKVILDLGANVGDTAIFYALKYPGAKIYAVEPNPQVHAKLELNTKQFPNIKVCKCAVSNKTGKINLYFGDSHLGSSINVRKQNTKSVEVDVYSLKDFCEKENIGRVDILKFDIEGAEEYLLQDAEYVKKNVVQVVGEMHPDLVGAPLGPTVARLELKNTQRTELSGGRYIIYGVL